MVKGPKNTDQSSTPRAIGRSRSPKGGTGVLTTVDGTPFFLQAEALKPFISEDLIASTTPIFYRRLNGQKSVGYDGELLPSVAEVYLKMGDAFRAESKDVPRQYDHIVKACNVIVRGLAHVGIIALIDEATGYQDVRDRQALQAILDKYLRKELAAWAKTFPDEFYQQIFRLRNWEWKGMKVNRPQVVAKYTTDFVYERLTPGLLEQLQHRNPKDDKGHRKAAHHPQEPSACSKRG